jgi:DNA-binding Lrp family transcriptional regulator
MRIRAFEGKDAKNNGLILEVLALNGSLIKWGILREMKTQTEISWPTVSRRVDDLKKRGYITETGKKKIRVKVTKSEKPSPTYGLTWKGLIAVLTNEKVYGKVLTVLQNNPKLKLPDVFWAMIKDFKEKEITNMVKVMVKEIRMIPLDLESTNISEINSYMFQALLFRVVPQIPEDYWDRLQRNPEFLKYLYGKLLEYEKMVRKSLKDIEPAKQRVEELMEKAGKGLQVDEGSRGKKRVAPSEG